jgi:acyl transferase domain-containing protein
MERAPIDAVPAASTSDVAIVGMACIFPGAATLREYWENIVAKVDATSDPPEEWEAELFYDPSSHENDRIYCKRGGYLGDLATFDPVKYGVMPSSIDGGEPDQFLALRVAHEALADAGYLDRPVNRERVGVIIGRGTYINRGFTTVLQHGLVVDRVLEILRQLHPEHSEGELSRIKRELKDSLPPFNAEMAPALVPNMMSGRIANRLDLMGPNYTVDAACASSLVAVDLAIQDLRSGRADLVLAGGVHASTPAPILQIFCQLGALSRRGQLRPFDADADGTLLGEGLGFLVLKRLGTAEADGDRIHAVLKGVGISSDGRALGLLAPRREGEELALRRAYADAGVDPASVGLVEAHGTGIPLGDEAEVQALTSVFGTERWGEGQWCALGSVKSMISHLIPAAGIAGMIKVALALYHKVLPATLHAENPNPALELHKTPFYLNTETRPWVHGHQTPRRAGVNAFGFGGINGHAILEEHRGVDDPAASSYQQRWDTEVCIVEAADRDDLVADCRRLHGSLSESTAELKDVAATLNLRSPGPCRLGLVASSVSDLVEKLGRAAERLSDHGPIASATPGVPISSPARSGPAANSRSCFPERGPSTSTCSPTSALPFRRPARGLTWSTAPSSPTIATICPAVRCSRFPVREPLGRRRSGSGRWIAVRRRSLPPARPC